METEPVSWESAGRITPETMGEALSEIKVECMARNVEQMNLPARLGEVHSAQGKPQETGARANEKRGTDLALQDQRDTWFAKRDQMRTEINRGRELLEQIQRELAALRTQLDEWPGYEVVCGKNPLSEYMQAIAAKERIEQYLPAWLKRREEQLHALDRQAAHCAKRNGANIP
jgi:hypothetical protein